jgi:hypothetical protein
LPAESKTVDRWSSLRRFEIAGVVYWLLFQSVDTPGISAARHAPIAIPPSTSVTANPRRGRQSDRTDLLLSPLKNLPLERHDHPAVVPATDPASQTADSIDRFDADMSIRQKA